MFESLFTHWIPVSYFTGYTGDTSWTFFKYFGTDSVYKAHNYLLSTSTSYAAVDDSYLKELSSFLDNLIKLNKFEFVHVDPSLMIRGEIIQMLFGKIPVLVAGGSESRIDGGNDIYGYNSIVTPDNYEEIAVNPRTVVWVSRDEKYAELIECLKDL